MRFGVTVFPGTNCEMDTFYAIREAIGEQADYVWHQDRDLSHYDAILIAGGFSYGDYLRTGAIARFAPVMDAIAEFAAKGGLVLGICNGFQILTEAGLLPGALQRNAHLKFRCSWVHLRVENADTPFTGGCRPGQVLRIPVNHGEGNYFADPDTLRELNENNQILFRYCTADGEVTPEASPNGSLENIAGIINKAGNVAGMMPHPERACEPILGSADGRYLLTSMVNFLTGRASHV
ncbi:phosphoribosylformylglycinamidine synthase [Symbiobacterium terraclitae]|uniref:Phosphoribosylformylglycinamidine synthase subunit PurQ n=1 Tax=Symbiobacterium terraclitae TaxID=557451 RepID=A0ABS4JVA9_9FIRM|nr:phosphoribosylformylglycinamidine synthase subunit PurQ [Symbiobacterium terraclitae]MBP2019449.1 phosphoribosylformylglycinamidine synthase [Symbiobacterium terraclitae]